MEAYVAFDILGTLKIKGKDKYAGALKSSVK